MLPVRIALNAMLCHAALTETQAFRAEWRVV